MLKVSLHFAPPARVSAQNVLGRLDIGYARLDAMADYKAVMFVQELGELPPVQMTNYPRWSASIWDLAARLACLSINKREAVWPAEMPVQRRGAFIDNMTAVVEHWPDGLDTKPATVGIAHIQMMKTRRNYRATFEDDLLGTVKSEVFRHTPDRLNVWDLFARAYAQAFTGTFALPPRPELYVPLAVDRDGVSYVAVDTVAEPARTGLRRWLQKRGVATATVDWLGGPCIAESQYIEFLRRAV